MKQTKQLSRSRWLLLTLLSLLMTLGGTSPAWADAKTLPYSYGFDVSPLDDGWKMVSCHNSSGPQISTKRTGNMSFAFHWADPGQYLISPEITTAANGVMISFYYMNGTSGYTSYTESFQVGYSTSDSETSSFTFGEEITVSNNAWNRYEAVFPVGTKFISIKCTSNDKYYLYIDDFSASVPPAFPKPTDLALEGTTLNSATLSWTEKGTATKWDISYSTASGEPDNPVDGNILSAVTSNPYTIEGLTSGTTYYVSVRSTNGTEHGEWSNEISFTPGLLTVNDGSSSISYAPFYGYYSNYGVKSQFIIPASELTSIQQSSITKLIFYHQSESVNWGTAQFKVYLKEVDKTAFNSTTFENWDGMEEVYSGSLSVSGNKMIITFDNAFAYEGGNLMIGINETTTGTSSSSSYNWLGTTATGYATLYNYNTTTNYTTSVPKVSIAYSPIANFVTKPKNVVQSAYTSTSVTVGWDNADGIDYWEVSYRETKGNPDEGTKQPLTTENSIVLSGLTAETTYYVYVRAKQGEYYSAWTSALEVLPTAAVDLTIYDKNNTSTNIPVYGNSSYSTKSYSQFIIPSTALTAVKDGTIKKLTFYSSDANKTLKAYTVYVTETDATTFTSNDASSLSGTIVYNGVMTIADNKLVISFNTPFNYTGRNLQIGIGQNSTEYAVASTWYGEDQTTNVARKYSRGSGSYAQFLPKTTITYIPYVPTEPVLRVTDPDTQILTESPASYDYGLTETAETRNFTLQNVGAGSLTVKSITATGGYLLKIGDADAAANIGSTVIGTSEVTPVTLKVIQPAGSSSGVITITTDVNGDEEDETFVINVSGVVRDGDKLYQEFNTTSKPSGWASSGTWSYTDAEGAKTNNTYSLGTVRLYTPKVTVAAGEKFIFEAKGVYPSNTSYQHLRIQYSADGNEWTTIGEEVSLTSDWKMFTITTPNEFVAGNYYIALNGSQVAVRKFYGGTEVLEPIVALSPTTKAFGLVTNEAPQTQIFTVTNTGKADLKNLTVGVPSGFTITKEDDSEWVNTQTVAANNGTQTFKVTMSNSVGVYSGNITIDGVYGEGNTAIEQKTIAVSGVVRDAECLFADFDASSAANRKPTEWTNTNWAFDNGKFAQAAYSGTSTLITEKLGVSTGQKLIFLANKPYTDATLGVFYCATNSEEESDWTQVTPADISTAAINTNAYYAISVGDGDGMIPVGDYFIKFVGTKYMKLDDISYFKKPLAGKFEMYEYDENADAPHLGNEITANQTKNLGKNVTETQTIKYVVKNAGSASMDVTASINGEAVGVTIAPTAPVTLGIGETQEYTITLAYDAENLGEKFGIATISAGELGEYTVTVSGTTRDGSKLYYDFTSGTAIPGTWTNTDNAWSTSGFGTDKYIYATSTNSEEPSRLITSRIVVAAGGENLAITAMKTDDAGTLAVYYSATKDGFTDENKIEVTSNLNTSDYARVNVNIPEGMEYIAFDGFKVRINELYGLANAPLMKVRETADGANLTTGMTLDFGMTAAAESKTYYVVNESAGSLAGVDASLTGTGFTLNKTNLTEAGGDFTITIDTSVKGYREATLTVSGTNQTDFVINLKGFVTDEEGKMLVNFDDNQLPANWKNADTNPWEFADGKAHTKDGNTANAMLTTCKLTVAANEVMAIKAKGETSGAELRVHVYQNGEEITAKKRTFDTQMQANTSDYTTLYFTGLDAGDYKLVFEGWKVYIDEIAGFTVNPNDPELKIYSDNAATMEVATATTKDFGWVADNADDAIFTATYYIKNGGIGTLTINNISEVEGFTAATAENATTITGDNTLALTITMDKNAIGEKSGTFTLTTDGGNFTIPVKGFVCDNTKNLVDFTSGEATFPAGWTTSGWTISDGAANVSSASTMETKKLTVAPNEKLYIDIKGNASGYETKQLSYSYSADNGENWTPAVSLVTSTTGTVADQVFTIEDIADTEAERTVLIRFTGQNLGIKHIYGFTKVNEAIMTTTAENHDFGMQASNVTPSDNAYTFTIKNDGNINLENLIVTLDGGEASAFTVAGSQATLTPNENIEITVTMKSSTEYGAKSDVLRIAAAYQTPVAITLTGKTRDASKQFIDFTDLDAIPNGWTAGGWTVNTPPASSDKAAYTNSENTMISPAMTFAAGESLFFDTRVTSGGTLSVKYTTDCGITWKNMTNLVTVNAMTIQELNFGNTNEVTVYVKFTGSSAFVDNIYGGVATTAPLLDMTTTELADNDGKYDFGQALLEAPAAKVYTFSNIGSADFVGTIAATGDVQASITETTGTQNGNEVTLTNGQTVTISVTLPYDADNTGEKAGSVTLTSSAGVATLNFIGKTVDNRTLNIDFADGQIPTGWYFGGNWSVNSMSQYAQNDYNSTPGDLITEQLAVAGESDALTFSAAKTDNSSYTFKVYTSQDRVEWTEVDLGELTLTTSYQTVTVSGLAAGDYYLRISGAYVRVDDFLGWKKKNNSRDLYVTATSYPADTQNPSTENLTASVTVTSLIAAESDIYAKLFINDVETATATSADVALRGSQTFSMNYTAPATAGTYTAQIKVYYSDDNVAFTTAVQNLKVYLLLDETIAPSLSEGEYDVQLNRSFTANSWNTICLPFAVADITAIFGVNAKAFEYKGFNNNTLNFDNVTALEAGKPYLLHVTTEVGAPVTFSNVSVTETTVGNVELNGVTFQGTYAPIAAPDLQGKYGIGTDNKLHKGSANATMNGFRGYFIGELAGARISTFDETTGITNVYATEGMFGDQRVYNLNGQHVENAKKGVFIVNGKKVVVK